MVRTLVFTLPPAAWKAEKSCFPTRSRAACRMGSSSSGARHVPREPPLERADQLGVDDAIAIELGARREARVEIVRRLLDAEHADIRRRVALNVAFSACLRSPAEMGLVSLKLATWPSACTPESVRPAPHDHRRSLDGRERLFKHLLHRPRVRLALEAREVGAVVRQRDLERTVGLMVLGSW